MVGILSRLPIFRSELLVLGRVALKTPALSKWFQVYQRHQRHLAVHWPILGSNRPDGGRVFCRHVLCAEGQHHSARLETYLGKPKKSPETWGKTRWFGRCDDNAFFFHTSTWKVRMKYKVYMDDFHFAALKFEV